MIPYTRTQWYGLSYLTQLSGSLLPRCLPLMILAGLLAGFVADGAVDRWFDYDFLDIFGETYSMSLFGVVFGYLSVARLNISYNRYWEGITNLKQMHSKWFDAISQILSFDQLEKGLKNSKGDPSLTDEPWCRHMTRLFAQLSAMATLMLHSEEPYDPVRLSEMMGQFSEVTELMPPKPPTPKQRSFTDRVVPWRQNSSSKKAASPFGSAESSMQDDAKKAIAEIRKLRRTQSGRIVNEPFSIRRSSRTSGSSRSSERDSGSMDRRSARTSCAILAKRRGTMNALMGAHNAGLQESGHQEQLLSDA